MIERINIKSLFGKSVRFIVLEIAALLIGLFVAVVVLFMFASILGDLIEQKYPRIPVEFDNR